MHTILNRKQDAKELTLSFVIRRHEPFWTIVHCHNSLWALFSRHHLHRRPMGPHKNPLTKPGGQRKISILNFLNNIWPQKLKKSQSDSWSAFPAIWAVPEPNFSIRRPIGSQIARKSPSQTFAHETLTKRKEKKNQIPLDRFQGFHGNWKIFPSRTDWEESDFGVARLNALITQFDSILSCNRTLEQWIQKTRPLHTGFPLSNELLRGFASFRTRRRKGAKRDFIIF